MDTPTIKTVDDLVKYALIYTDNRYKLEHDYNYVWDDPVAGKAWEDSEVPVSS